MDMERMGPTGASTSSSSATTATDTVPSSTTSSSTRTGNLKTPPTSCGSDSSTNSHRSTLQESDSSPPSMEPPSQPTLGPKQDAGAQVALPRRFEQLQLKATTVDSRPPPSDTSCSICRLSQEPEGTVKEPESSSVASMSPSPPLLTLASASASANKISKCLSQSSCTTGGGTSSTMSIDSDSPSVPLSSNFTSRQVEVPKTQSLDLVDDEHRPRTDHDQEADTDADVEEDEDLKAPKVAAKTTGCKHQAGCVRRDIPNRAGDEVVTTAQKGSQTDPPAPRASHPPRVMIPKIQSLESRPIYPNVPYSPYGSPFGSPRSNRRRTPLRESRRVSIEQSGSFLQLNQYKLMDQIGQGSYGLVKLAYNEEDSTHYAMKILSKRRLLRKAGLMGRGPKKTTSPLDRVYREIAVLKKLDHPNVVKLVEVLDDPLEDSLYLVFELVKQGEVLSVPTEQPLSEERAWCVFRDALQGLEYLHYQRIIHGDIKPGNLLLGEFGRVKIADLGVCNEFFGEDAAMNNGSTAGTPAFRAPETLIPGQHMYSGKAADIWALGATLYALIYGNVPFVANSVPAVYEKIKNDQLKLPEQPAISPELRDLLEKILTKDPSRRITLPQIKEHLWVTAIGACCLPSEEENCRLVQISDEDIHTVVKSIPKLDTLILIKTMLKNHSFQNPFSKAISGRAPQRGGSRLERFTRAGRSNSAPGAYHMSERQLSSDSILPAVSETVASSCNESSDQSLEG